MVLCGSRMQPGGGCTVRPGLLIYRSRQNYGDGAAFASKDTGGRD